MDKNEKASWSDYWIECWKINETVTAGVCLLLTLAILGVWCFYATSTGTTYGIEYKWAQELATDSLNYKEVDFSCCYPNCTYTAEQKIESDTFFPHIMSAKGMNILLNLPNCLW